MKWYHLVAAFAAGFFLGNAVPHFVAGVMGQSFPSPFANPPGQGLSSPLVNTLWGLTNILIGYVLVRAGRVQMSDRASMAAFFLGLSIVGVMTSLLFGEAMGNPSF